MDVKIGIKQSARELSFESNDSASAIEASVSAAFAGGLPTVKFTDNKGRQFVVPTESIAYVEIGAEEARRVGFIA
ncbi:MAG: hypothetical protein RL016_544 [Actinomycetota bacterium]